MFQASRLVRGAFFQAMQRPPPAFSHIRFVAKQRIRTLWAYTLSAVFFRIGDFYAHFVSVRTLD